MIKGEELVNRDGAPQVEGKRRREQPAAPTPEERLELLETRLVVARVLEPTGNDLHCADCFHRGRDAVLRLLGGET